MAPMRRAALLTCSLLAAPSAASAQQGDGSGLKTTAAVDLTGEFKAAHGDEAEDRFAVREAEVMLYAPIDHVFDGVLSAAAHDEDGERVLEVHEAVITTSKLIPRSTLKLGQFFLGVGRLNQVHRHEWPFITAPRVHREFFGPEGALDSGAQYTWLAPTPFVLDLAAGVTNGYTYGHSDEEGVKPKQPTHYARAATYVSLPGKGGMQVALNGLARTDAAAERMTLAGVDLTAKWREAGVLNFLLQSEVWQRTTKPKDGDAQRALGAYVYPQYAFSSEWFAGLLADYYTVPTQQDEAGEKVKNSYGAATPTVTYKASEFSTLRLAYEFAVQRTAGADDVENRKVEMQATYIIGAHPAHDF